ncbi:MAG: glycosyltransferase family 4 protein [Phycisphaerae bacterium]|nr:glycosyltransferase family 4 protein [Phycisphaerae bacterium]
MLEDSPPLHEVSEHSWLVRKSALLTGRAMLLVLRLAVDLAAAAGQALRTRRANRKARVVLTGMFVSDGWIEAHVRPMALSERCEHIWVVTDRPMVRIPKTTYVCAPRWLQRLIGLVPSRSIWCLWTALRHRPDAVGGFHMLLNGIVALIAARLVGGRSLYFCVGGWAEIWGGGARSENRFFSRIGEDDCHLERQILWFVGQTDLTLTMGTRALQYLRQRGISNPIEVVSGGIDPSSFAAATQPGRRPHDLIFVGRLVPIKRPDVLLAVIAKVVPKRPDLRVVVVGDGPLRPELEARAVELGIAENVSFVGHRSDVKSWYSQARIFVLTSDSEGLPLSATEAMTAGLPVVVSDVGDLGDLVRDGVNGYRPRRRDVEGFASRIVELLADEKKQQAFSEQARRSATAYSVDSMRRRWDRLLGDLTRPRARPRARRAHRGLHPRADRSGHGRTMVRTDEASLVT